MTVMADLARARVPFIPRWLGHGDLQIVIMGGHVYLRADQTEQLAGIPPWSTGETLLGDTWPLELDGNPFYDLDDAIARCEAANTPTAAEFLTWLDDTLTTLLDDDVLDAAQHLPGFIGSHPVRVAARTLATDLGITLGQNTLFAHLRNLGWLTRTTDDHEITTLARRNGWLTTRDVTIPAATPTRRRTYPQIYITPTGLEELRTLLTKPTPTAPTHPAPALFD